MLVKFPVWEYHNTQLGFSLQLNSNTKKGLSIRKNRKSFFRVHGAIISQPLFAYGFLLARKQVFCFFAIQRIHRDIFLQWIANVFFDRILMLFYAICIISSAPEMSVSPFGF